MLRVKLGLLLVPVVCLAVILGGCGGVSGSSQTGPSFTLSASPSSVIVAPGGQATSTITITPQNGFNGSVTLSAPVLPNGVTAAFNPDPATTTSTLTLTATANAQTGPATVTITGMSGTLTSSTTLSLTVAFFTLSASPSSVTIAQGGQGTSTITVTPANGFSGSVNLSASGLPNGVTATFNPNPATTTSALTLAASATAATGTVTVTITGMSGTLSNSTTLSLTVNGQGQSGQIKHVVIIFQENRTPDNLFHDPVLMNRMPCPGACADIATEGKTSTGQIVTLTPVPLVTSYDLGHSHTSFLDACDYNPSTNTCAMDGADKIACGPNCPANASYQYVQASDVQPYFQMAETYSFGDRMFQTNEGPSFPAHQYILSGTSSVCTPGGNCPTGTTSTSAVADNPGKNARPDGTYWAGCLAPPGAFVNFIDTSQSLPTSPTFPVTDALCAEHPTLTDLLNNAGLSWKYYAAQPGSIWTAPDAIQHMCVPSPAYPSDTSVCTGSDWTNHVVIENSKALIINDIAAGQLADVSWVIPNGAASDHANGNQGKGPSWVAAIVNAVGNSPYWADTAIIVTWDDWGGWYDHQPPPSIRDSYEYGLRVPLIVISTYAKPAYVSHQVNDFGSILKFVEENFSLQQIDPSLGYADSHALGDLSDFFDFSQTQPFTPIQAPLKADYFLHDNDPVTPPDND